MTEPSPHINTNWFAESFGEDYLTLYVHRNLADARKEAAWAVKALGLSEGDCVLDFCCGAGRHSAALRELGLGVVGFDLSRQLLAKARQVAVDDGVSFDGVRADMRAVPFGASFDGVLSFFTSFGYFPTDEENLAVLSQYAAALKPGGRVMLDVPNPAHVRANLVAEDEKHQGGWHICSRRWLVADGRRVEKEVTVTWDGPTKQYHESVRLFELNELEGAMARHGLALERVYGGLDGSPHSREHPRMVVLGSREK